jgi:hypothetical protein
MPNKQAYESAYLLVKARRVHDATLRLSHAAAAQAQAAMPSSAARQVPPAYLAHRVGEGQGAAALPGMEVRGPEVLTSGRGGRKRRDEALVLEQVVRRVVEGISVELARVLMEM